MLNRPCAGDSLLIRVNDSDCSHRSGGSPLVKLRNSAEERSRAFHAGQVNCLGKQLERNGSRYSVGRHPGVAPRTATGRSPAPALQINSNQRRLMRLASGAPRRPHDRSNSLLTTPGAIEFTNATVVGGLPWCSGSRLRDRGTNIGRCAAQDAATSIKSKLNSARRNPNPSIGLIAICTPRNEASRPPRS